MRFELRVNDRVVIPPGEIDWRAVRSSGPGGQNVNKVASKVELRFDLGRTRALDEATRLRLRALAAGRLDADGKMVITSQLTRDQARNLGDALDKLRALIQRALVPPRPRRATKPSRGARERRFRAKQRRGAIKRSRHAGGDD